MNVSRGKVSLGRIKEVLDTKPSIVFNDKAPDEVLSGDVEFNDVSFTIQVVQSLLCNILALTCMRAK